MAASKPLKIIAYLWIGFLAFQAAAQQRSPENHQVIFLEPRKYRLDSLLTLAAKQTGLVFSYSPQALNVRQYMTLKSSKLEISTLLAWLKKEGMTVKRIENYIVLSTALKPKRVSPPLKAVTKESGKTPAVQEAVNTIATTNKISPVKIVTPMIDTLKKLHDHAASKPSDSIAIQRTRITQPIQPKDTLRLDTIRSVDRQRKPDQTKNTAPQIASSPKPSPKTTEKTSPFFIDSGMALDESSFVGLSVRTGIPLLYGTLSAHTNFSVSHVRYGLGTSIGLSRRLRLRFNFSRGDITKSGFYYDSTGSKFPIAAKSTLTRYSVALEFFRNKKISLQAGLVFNQLVTHYYINNAPATLSRFTNGDHLFYTLYPPYLLSNTYSPTAVSNTKTWIGPELSVYYFIPIQSRK